MDRDEAIFEAIFDIQIKVGRIEGYLASLTKLPDRVSRLEMWQSWLKGGLAAIAMAYAYLCRRIF
jgi:hypothetical protein